MAVPELQPIEGKYEILEKLNEGGMGAVYKVRHRLLEEIRVIKVIRPQLQADENLNRRFLREARAAVRLRHPNIAELYDFTVAEDGTAYMVIEFIDGMDLTGLIQLGNLPSVDLVLEIGVQSLRALAYLHRKKFVHRDISPDNLMLTKDVEGGALIKLIDLGIAKPLQSEMRLTGEGFFLGKIRYASPEQFGGRSGKAEVDQRSDLYSFGIVLYELLTGAHPITGTDNQSLLAGHLFHPPRDFDDTDPDGRVPAALRELVMKALEKEPEDRYASAEEFSQALEKIHLAWVEPAAATGSLDATLIRPRPLGASPRPGSTQSRLDQEFAPHPTPPPRRLEAVPAPDLVERESALQACCEKIEHLITSKRLLEAEVELRHGEKSFGDSVLLRDLQKRLKELRNEVNEAVVRARLLQREGDLEVALEQLNRARELDIESPEVSAQIESVRSALSERTRAVAGAREAVENQLESGQLEVAKRLLEEAEDKFGRFADLRDLRDRVVGLLTAAERVRQLAKAAGEIKQLVDAKRLPEAGSALTAAIRTYGEDEMFADLAEQIREAETRQRERERLEREAKRRREVEALLAAAREMVQREEWEGALEPLQRAEILEPENPETLALLNRSRSALERRQAQQRRTVELERVVAQAESLLESRELDRAEELLAAAEAEHGSAKAVAALRVRIEEERFRQREKEAGELLKKSFRLLRSGQLDAAHEAAERALSISPASPEAQRISQEIRERRSAESRQRALAAARASVLAQLEAGALEQAEKALAAVFKEHGRAEELLDLEKRVHDRLGKAARQQEIDKAAQSIDKLIGRQRLEKASAALAEAVRAHGRDRTFDELAARIEEVAAREKAARSIVAPDTGAQRIPARSTRLLSAAAAAAVLIVAAIAGYQYLARPTEQLQGEADAPPSEPLESFLDGVDLGEFHALVIGNNAYRMGLPELETAVNDARELARILEDRYGFEVSMQLDATRYEILSLLEDYVDRLDSDDNLMIFYAGHGFVDQVTGRGYWQPVDAEPDNTANWISSLEVSDILLDVPARRVLVVADSCFSGAFLEGREGTSLDDVEAPTSSGTEVLDRLDKRARLVLTSGSLQPVIDSGLDGHSIFSRALVSALDANSNAIESATLFNSLRRQVSSAVTDLGMQQLPQFAPLDSDGGGVFLFVPTG